MKLEFEPFYQQLLNTMAAYALAQSTIYTDQCTIAPKKGAARANEAMSILGQAAFEISNNPETIKKIREYRDRLEDGTLEKKEVDLRCESIADTEDVPASLFGEYLQTRADSETAWHEAKEASDYEHFRPHLEQVVNKTIELARFSPKFTGDNEYDVLLDQYERGLSQEEYDAFFDTIRAELVPLIEKVSKARQIDTSFLNIERSEKKQEEFMEKVMAFLQADPGRVYLSTTEHPFTDFFSHDDVRITTHYYPEAFLSAILSTVHEYGHALYALQTEAAFDKTMLMDAIGCAAHESQSRFLENHIGRSEAFWKALYPALCESFPEFADYTPEDIVKMINASERSLIRTEADELTYPLHILIRYEIEKMMMKGELDFNKLPEIWADKYEEYLGVRPSTDKEGVLQDMHWSAGNLGYFPTYALGSAYAAQLFEAMSEEIDVPAALESGQFDQISEWQRKNVHRHGASKSMREIVEEVSRKPFDPTIYTNYLKDKYTRLYNLD